MLNAGMILSNRYEIIELVGSGGMSEVYKAKCHVLNRYVAIKVLKPEFSQDVNFVTKFRIEAQSAAGLSHPNIVNVYDVGEDNGIYYIVMELVEGITLKEYIEKKGRLMPDEAIKFAIEIAQGLQAAHEHHTIHRDIKPQNIIVAKNGAIKVTDFGIARAASSNTMTSNAMGSVHYISPEQARGGYSDERSDIYSLGITLFEMLTGHVPFEGDNNVSIALQHIQGEIPSPRSYYEDIPTSLEKIIAKATQKKPERRYLTASAFIADLKRVQENPNIDCVVVPPVVPSSPTVQMTKEELEAIKNGRVMGEEDAVDGQAAPADDQYGYDYDDDYGDNAVNDTGDTYGTNGRSARSSRPQATVPEVAPSKFDELFDDDYDDYDDGYDDDDSRAGVTSARNVGASSRGTARTGIPDDEVDPGLKKVIVIAAVAAALIVIILIVVLIGEIAGWNLFSSSKDKDKNDVLITSEATSEDELLVMDDVVGLYKNAAEETLKKIGFTNIKFEEVSDDDPDKVGYVLRQSVNKGEKIPKDEEIILYISKGPEDVKVPNVVGMDKDQAEKTLTKAGFKVTKAYEFDDKVEKDQVISTDPEAGTKAASGSTIKIVISNGAEETLTTVPKLVGKSETEATSLLSSAKLYGSPSYEFSDTVPAGQVISQGTPAGSEIAEGTTITYVVSKGKESSTYKVTFSGSISNNVYDFDTLGTVSVTITYTVDGNTHTLYSGAATDSSFPLSIDSAAPITGLTSNSGTFGVTIVDSSNNDVTAMFNTSGLVASFSEE